MERRAPVVLTGRRKALLVLVLVLLVVLGVDLLFRGFLVARGLPAGPAAIRTEIQRVSSLILDRIPTPENEARTTGDGIDPFTTDVAHPFIGFDMLAGMRQITTDREYFRSEAAARTYDVLVLGGSVAGRFGNLSRKAFVERLRADPRFASRPIHVLGHGRGAHKQPQQATLLAFLLASGYAPDAVINIDGFNEVAIGLDNSNQNAFPMYPAVAYWGKVQAGISGDPTTLDRIHRMVSAQREVARVTARALDWHLEWSAVAGHFTIQRLQSLRSAYGAAYDEFVAGMGQGVVATAAMRGPPAPERGVEALDVIARSWVEGSVSIDAMCRARSIHYLHVLQPTLHDEGAKKVTPEEAAKGVASTSWLAGVRFGYPKLRAAGERLRKRGVAFRDLSRIFADVTETIYYDACHFDGVGNEMFGVAVAEAFLDSLPEP